MMLSQESLAHLRAEIDAVDELLLSEIKRRLAIVKRMRDLKMNAGIPARDLIREQELVERIQRLNSESEPRIPKHNLTEIFNALIRLSLQEQADIPQNTENYSSSRNQ